MELTFSLMEDSKINARLLMKDFAWLLPQTPSPSEEITDSRPTVPGLSGFNAIARNQKITPQSTVVYCQLIVTCDHAPSLI